MHSVAQSFLTLYDPLDCSPPSSSVHGIFQAVLVLLLRHLIEWPSQLAAGAPITRRQIEKHVCQNTSRQGWGRGGAPNVHIKNPLINCLGWGLRPPWGMLWHEWVTDSLPSKAHGSHYLQDWRSLVFESRHCHQTIWIQILASLLLFFLFKNFQNLFFFFGKIHIM